MIKHPDSNLQISEKIELSMSSQNKMVRTNTEGTNIVTNEFNREDYLINKTKTQQTLDSQEVSLQSLQQNKQNVLTAGDNIIIENDVISASVSELATAKTIDGVSFDGSADIIHYGTCSIAAATAAKTVACTGFTLATGARISVTFADANTAATPTLNVNSTGAKQIRFLTGSAPAGASNVLWAAGQTVQFVYNGTYWLIEEQPIRVKLTQLAADTTACADTDCIPMTPTANTAWVRRTLATLWTWIAGKISSVLRLTATAYGGKAATAGTADSAENASKTTNAITFSNSGNGAESGSTFNGSAAQTLSYNSIGAAAANHTHTGIPTGTVGATRTPIYLSSGSFVACSKTWTYSSILLSNVTISGSGTTITRGLFGTSKQGFLFIQARPSSSGYSIIRTVPLYAADTSTTLNFYMGSFWQGSDTEYVYARYNNSTGAFQFCGRSGNNITMYNVYVRVIYF